MPFGEQGTPPAGDNAAIAFLRRHGHTSLVSLGCSPELNRLDNHLRLLVALNLTYYVGIDCVPAITWSASKVFVDQERLGGVGSSTARRWRTAGGVCCGASAGAASAKRSSQQPANISR